MIELYDKTGKLIPIKPKGIYYDNKKDDKYNVTSITTKSNHNIPVTPSLVSSKVLERYKLKIENKPLYDAIDKLIKRSKTDQDAPLIVDERIENVNYDKFSVEAYELFRLEFSEYINKEENISLRARLEEIITSDAIKHNKIKKIRLFIYKIIDDELYENYTKLENMPQEGGKEKFIKIRDGIPNLNNYSINNDRNVCSSMTDKNHCSTNITCQWINSACKFSLTKDMIIMFVNKISEELLSGDHKSFEILKIGNYFVSDIVNFDKFTEAPNQRIIRSSSNMIQKAMNTLFGKDNVPKIGKRRNIKDSDVNLQQMNIDNPLRDLKDIYVQNIINNNLTIYRAYVNGFFWLRHALYDTISRNLGYYSPLQTELSNYFKSQVIDWSSDSRNKSEIDTELKKYMDIKRNSIDFIHDFIIKIGSDIFTLTNCIVELYILNKIQNIAIVVHDDDNNIVYVFDNGLKYHHIDSNKMKKDVLDSYSKDPKSIHLRFSFISHSTIPDEIEILYPKS